MNHLFEYKGQYRVQSRASGRASLLRGSWIPDSQGDDLNDEVVNGWLKIDERWRGSMSVSLRPAYVTDARGDFLDEPDILYKKDNFEPEHGTATMPSNIVDVKKAASGWRQRRSLAEALVGNDCYAEIDSRVGVLDSVIANEYFVHEAGHALGYDVEAKTRDEYFRPGDRIRWTLVFVEEFRADLLGFGFAARCLPAPMSASIFLYNIFLRLGVHLEAIAAGKAHPYGGIPFMLYALLREGGWLSPGRNSPLCVRTLSASELVSVISYCHEHGGSRLLDPELDAASSIDVAINAATYYRTQLTDTIVAELNGIIARACDLADRRHQGGLSATTPSGSEPFTVR
jgi:hypothetical protein